MRFFIFPLLLGLSTTAHASGASIWWPAWSVSSTEELSQGVKYPQKYSAPRYPLARLCDGNPKTAWVYNATSREFDSSTAPSRYGLQLKPDKPVALDEIRLVNGQNSSPERFRANHRAETVRITLSNGKRRRVYLRSLADKQGWQSVRFPRFRAANITLDFPQIVRSKSKDADFCLSEIELRQAGRKIDWKMPRLVMYYDGLEGDADAPLLIKRDGFPVDSIGMDAGYVDSWSPSGRFVASCGGEETNGREDYTLWVYDAVRGVKISKLSPKNHRKIIISKLAAPMSQSDQKWLGQLPELTSR
jgi:hypothetical protein